VHLGSAPRSLSRLGSRMEPSLFFLLPLAWAWSSTCARRRK
jgi:hypothetical protein